MINPDADIVYREERYSSVTSLLYELISQYDFWKLYLQCDPWEVAFIISEPCATKAPVNWCDGLAPCIHLLIFKASVL